MALVLCGIDTDETTSASLPFSSHSFLFMARAFRLAGNIFSAILTGTPSYIPATERGYSTITMRTPLSNSNNWTLALAWDHATFEIRGIIHGFQKRELEALLSSLAEFETRFTHPLLMPVILCELLTESDSTAIKRHASSLYQVEIRTVYMRVEKTGRPGIKGRGEKLEEGVEDLTRSLNAIVSRLAFHEMRVTANAGLVAAILEQLAEGAGGDKDTWEDFGIPLRSRLEALQHEHRALLLEVACNQKIAAGQLQIVYNLIAQRDALENLRQASTSTAIARLTKEDGFAMRTIAFLTITFLPATAVSSLFSMGMFDWQADSDAPVVSARFWVYWAVAVPLTLVVLALWGAWMLAHKELEKKDPIEKTASLSSMHGDRSLPSTDKPGLFARFRKTGQETTKAKKKPKRTLDVEAVEMEDRASTRASLHVQFERGPAPADTFVQGPLR